MSLFNLIKRTRVTNSTEDTGQYPVVQVGWNDKVSDIENITPYGVYNRLPVDSIVLTFNVNGQEENKAGIGNNPKIRFKNLKEGEVYIGNPLTGSVVKFLENGDIEVIAKNDQNISVSGGQNVNIAGNQTINVSGNASLTVGGSLTANVTGNTTVTSPTVTVNGDLDVTGDIIAFSTSPTPISMSNFKSAYNIHTHISAAVGNPTSVTSNPI